MTGAELEVTFMGGSEGLAFDLVEQGADLIGGGIVLRKPGRGLWSGLGIGSRLQRTISQGGDGGAYVLGGDAAG